MRLHRLWFCGLSCLVMSFACSDAERNTQSAQPNILVIAVDDLNDWIGALNGHPGMDIQTPNIDRLAESSLLFTKAQTPAPACAPARIAIMTGVHPSRSGMMHNVGGDGAIWRKSEALRDVETLEQFFKNRGYTTLGGGKLYHSQAPPWTTFSQVEPANWDFYYPSPYLTHPHQIRPPDEVIYPEGVDNRNRPGGMPGWWTWGPIDAPDEKMADYHLVDWASYELRRQHGKPFFLVAGIWKPHDPFEVPRKYFDMYPLENIVLPEAKEDDLEDAFDHGRRAIHRWVLQNDQWKQIVQAYAASISFADAMVGRLLAALEGSAYADNTIVVLWGDHGMHMGQKENFEKFTLWEASTRVPFMIRAPGVTRSGSRSDQPVSLLDLYPTLAALAGFEIPEHVDGTSLIPQLKDPDARRGPVVSSYRFDFGRFHMGAPAGPEVGHAVRSHDYRYIYYVDTGLEELYDHRSDPEEWNNSAYRPENAEIVREHRQYLLDVIPDLVWSGQPKGYQIDADGTVRKTGYVRMSTAAAAQRGAPPPAAAAELASRTR